MVRDVGNRLAGGMKEEGAAPLVCFNVDGNEISSVRIEELRRRFKEC